MIGYLVSIHSSDLLFGFQVEVAVALDHSGKGAGPELLLLAFICRRVDEVLLVERIRHGRPFPASDRTHDHCAGLLKKSRLRPPTKLVRERRRLRAREVAKLLRVLLLDDLQVDLLHIYFLDWLELLSFLLLFELLQHLPYRLIVLAAEYLLVLGGVDVYARTLILRPVEGGDLGKVLQSHPGFLLSGKFLVLCEGIFDESGEVNFFEELGLNLCFEHFHCV